VSLFSWLETFGAEPIQGDGPIWSRVIDGQLFQFKKAAPRVRFDFGVKSLAFAKPLSPLVGAGIKIAFKHEDSDSDEAREEFAASLESSLPAVLDGISDPKMLNFVHELSAQAWWHDGEKFQKLDQDHIEAKAYDNNDLLRVAVAATVLEVNLDRGFFGKLQALMGLGASKTEASENAPTVN